MEEAYGECKRILIEHRDKLELIAQALMEHETLTAAELKSIVFGDTNTNTSTIDLTKIDPAVQLQKREQEFESVFEAEPPASSSTPSDGTPSTV